MTASVLSSDLRPISKKTAQRVRKTRMKTAASQLAGPPSFSSTQRGASAAGTAKKAQGRTMMIKKTIQRRKR